MKSDNADKGGGKESSKKEANGKVSKENSGKENDGNVNSGRGKSKRNRNRRRNRGRGRGGGRGGGGGGGNKNSESGQDSKDVDSTPGGQSGPRTGPSKSAQRKQRAREANKDKRSQRQKRDPPPPKQKYKVVIRMLPPNISEEQFKALCQPWNNTIDWKMFSLEPPLERPGKMFARAYLKFKSPVDQNVRAFHAGFPRALADDDGDIYNVLVEYSLYQKFEEKRKVDHRMGSIFEDKDYKAFLDELQKADEPIEAKVASVKLTEKEDEIGALVKFLQERHVKNRSRRSRRIRGRLKGSKGKDKDGRRNGDRPRRKRRRRRRERNRPAAKGKGPKGGDKGPAPKGPGKGAAPKLKPKDPKDFPKLKPKDPKDFPKLKSKDAPSKPAPKPKPKPKPKPGGDKVGYGKPDK